MKKKLLLAISMVALLACIFAISVSAETVLKEQSTNAYGELSFFDESITVGRSHFDGYGFTPYMADGTSYARIVVGNGTTYYTFPTVYVIATNLYNFEKNNSISLFDFNMSSLNSAMEAATGTNPGWTKSNVYRVELPANMKRFNGGSQCFSGFENVKEIYLQPNTTTIDTGKNCLFHSCKNLETIHNLDSFVFRKGTTGGSFQNCAKLTNITFGVSPEVDDPGENMFNGCTSLVSTNVQEALPNLTKIGKQMFYNCTSLSHFSSNGQEYAYVMPSSVTRIEQNAFNSCKGVKYISISPNVTYIGPSSFHTCTSLEFVDFNGNQNDVDFNNWGVFMNCTSLKAMSLPDNTDYITNRIFSKCTSLQAVYLPSATKTIETNGYGDNTAFYNCYEMFFVNEQFSVRDENGNFYGDSFNMPTKPEIYYFPSGLTNLFQRDSGIGFAFCYNLNPIMVMPETLTKFWINDGVFYCCGDKGNKTTVVFLGDMTDLRIGMRDSRAKGISYVFANSADTDFSSVKIVNSNTGNYSFNLNGDEFIYFCSTGKGITMKKPSSNNQFTNSNTELAEMNNHLFKIAKETAPTCTANGVRGFVCFCGKASEQSVVLPATGHSKGDFVSSAYPISNGAPNYFENMIAIHVCAVCGVDAEFTVEDSALFGKKGYSFSEMNSKEFSYTIYVNSDAIAQYGNGIKYGIFASATTNGTPLSVVDGKVVGNEKTVAMEMQDANEKYSIIQVKLTNVGEGKELHLGAFASQNEAITYMGHDSVSAVAEVISHAILVEKYTSKEDIESSQAA